MPQVHQARRGQLDRALPPARHRPGVLRGLDLARPTTSSSATPSSARPGSTSAAWSSSPRTGSYFTRELDAARTSVIVVRTADGGVRAFHNICRHRGNKLVWNDYPQEETSGTCRQFTCKYHGWRYGLEGDLTFVQQERRVLRPRQGRLRPGRRAGGGVGGVHLREPRRRGHRLAGRLHGRARGRPGGLPVRRDDPGLQVPGGRRGQLEALHRRLRRVLPRTCPAREAGHRRGVAQAPGVRLRGARRTSSTARTAWCRRGAAWPRRPTRAW